ncbi:MAG: peptidylprolyl isomerase [Planctomycetes bacterium]|nr:peptidylprolyl isomerase [Planctomycetota bacterium]
MKIFYTLISMFLLICGLSAEGKAAKEGVFASMETSKGTILIELNFEKAPISTANFVRYAREGFYENTIFHRVMPTFMIQGGQFSASVDKKTAGLHVPIKNEWRNGLKNNRGTIAMARTSAPDSATAQFFINVVDNGMLDQPRGGAAYAVFGKVVEGLDVVDAIKGVECVSHPKYRGGGNVVPKETVLIKKVTISGKFDEEAMKKQISRLDNYAEIEKAEKEGEIQAVIKKIEKDHKASAVKTASGLYYIETKAGTGKKPPSSSTTVTVHYEGKLLNGSKFDSSFDRGEPIDFPLNRVIGGWTEGVQKMKEGGECYLVIPPELGYGARGAGASIPPNSWLVFKVQLLKVH